MCSTCGCGRSETSQASHAHSHAAAGPAHDPAHVHDDLPAEPARVLQVEAAILAENERHAAYNRGFFDGKGIRCINIISAPGSGKTTLLEKTLAELLRRGIACAVIEGDQHTDRDARRIAATGAKVRQIETGRACHLDAHQVGHAVEDLSPERGSILFVENVGNLICPTEFDLGEHERVVLLSAPEGTDKPAKYPLAFRSATAVVLAKTDLLPHVDFDPEEALRLVAGLNPRAKFFQLSARTGDGLPAWFDWILAR